MELHNTDSQADVAGRRNDNDSQRRYVKALEQRIIELEAENKCLKQAAGTFGELAERLNALLQARREEDGDKDVSLRRSAQ
jgi:hypothetical protein